MCRTMAAAWMALAVAVAGCSGGERKVVTEEVVALAPPVEPSKAEVKPDSGVAVVALVAPIAVVPESGPALAHEDSGPVDHVARARELEETGDLAGALAEFRRATFDDSSKGQALEGVGRIARRTPDFALAGAAYLELSKTRPTDALPLVKLARVRLDAGDAKGAIAAATEAAGVDPGVAEAHHLRGLGELKLGALASALRDFRKAIELSPDHGWAQNNLGYALLLAGRPLEAREPLERAATLLPKVAFVYNNLGIVYEKLQLKDEAQAAYERALSLNPRYVKAKVNRSRMQVVAQADAAAPMEVKEPTAGASADLPGQPALEVKVETAPAQ